MSGICAIVNFDGSPVDREQLIAIARTARHRGPDGIHYWTDGFVGLAYLALHTTPESVAEHQPRPDQTERRWIVADARVDNRTELIARLQPAGFAVNAESGDAALILAAYQQWGDSCLDFVIGDFAFAIWDVDRRSLFCGRDPFGVKQLHFARAGRTLIVATELEQILVHPGVSRAIDEIALGDYLASYFHDEERTLFHGVRRLAPGHRLTVTASTIIAQRYWTAEPRHQIWYRDNREYEEHFLELLRRSVRARLRSTDSVFGIAMSGGMDSTTIASLAQAELSQCGIPDGLHIYSMAYPSLPECDERKYVEAVARNLGTDVDYICADELWFLRYPVHTRLNLESTFLWNEAPLRLMLERAQTAGGKVFLTGEGGDNLLRGSPLVYADLVKRGNLRVFVDMAQRARLRNVSFRRLLWGYYAWIFKPLLVEPFRGLMPWIEPTPGPHWVPTWLTEEFTSRTGLHKRVRQAAMYPKRRGAAREAIREDIIFLAATGRAVHWYDSTAARFCIEPRHPLLDRQLAEFILAVPPEQLFGEGHSKWLLRRAMRGILPDAVRERTSKTIFDNMMARSLRVKEVARIRELLNTSILGIVGVVDIAQLIESYENYLLGKDPPVAFALISTVVVELWLRQYFSLSSNCDPVQRLGVTH